MHMGPIQRMQVNMALSFSPLSWWWWSGKQKAPEISNGPAENSSSELGIWESDTLRFPLVKRADMGSSSRRVKRRRQSREERRIDREYDVVLVPSDGVCVSGSESDVSDWSIGWSEPHGPGFLSDDESNNSFAVLVPCYGRGPNYMVENSKNDMVSAVMEFPDESKKYMEQWLSILQND